MSVLTKTTRSLVRNIQGLQRMSAISSSKNINQCIQYQQTNAFGSMNKNTLCKSFLTNNQLLVKVGLNVTPVRNYSHVPYTIDMIEQRVLLVLSLYDKINADNLKLSSDFTKDLGLDSLDQVDIVIAMEDEFGFEIPDQDGEFLTSPGHIVQYVCDKFDVYE